MKEADEDVLLQLSTRLPSIKDFVDVRSLPTKVLRTWAADTCSPRINMELKMRAGLPSILVEEGKIPEGGPKQLVEMESRFRYEQSAATPHAEPAMLHILEGSPSTLDLECATIVEGLIVLSTSSKLFALRPKDPHAVASLNVATELGSIVGLAGLHRTECRGPKVLVLTTLGLFWWHLGFAISGRPDSLEQLVRLNGDPPETDEDGATLSFAELALVRTRVFASVRKVRTQWSPHGFTDFGSLDDARIMGHHMASRACTLLSAGGRYLICLGSGLGAEVWDAGSPPALLASKPNVARANGKPTVLDLDEETSFLCLPERSGQIGVFAVPHLEHLRFFCVSGATPCGGSVQQVRKALRLFQFLPRGCCAGLLCLEGDKAGRRWPRSGQE